MRLFRRRRVRPLRPEDAELVLHVALELRDALALYRGGLDDLADERPPARDDLLAQARRIAALNRMVALTETPDFYARFPGPVAPHTAMFVLDSVSYGLVALAQSPPDTSSMITRDELDALVTEEVSRWLELCLQRAKDIGWA